MQIDSEMKKVAEKHMDEHLMSPNVYWQIATAVVDTWRQCLCRMRRFENAHKIMSLIDEEYNGNICELEIERDEYHKLVDFCLSMFDSACVLFNIEPIDFRWLEDNVDSSKACKRLGVEIKRLMYRGCEPVSIKSI